MLCHTGNFAKINHIFVSLFSLHIVRTIHSYGVGEIYQWESTLNWIWKKKKLTEEKGKGKKRKKKLTEIDAEKIGVSVFIITVCVSI